MKRMHAQSGSMVLTCVFFISICMLIMLLQWRSQEALHSIMILRMQALKKQYAAEALLQYGIDLGKKQYITLAQIVIKRKAPIILTFKRWPLGNDHYAQGTLEISYTDRLGLRATLFEQDVKQILLSCNLEKQIIQQQNIYTVTSWKRHEIHQKS